MADGPDHPEHQVNEMRRFPMELWLLAGVLAVFSLPALASELVRTVRFLTAPPPEQGNVRTLGWSELLALIESTVPLDEPILLDLPQRVTDLHVDRQLNYWLYPRRLYSAHALRLRNRDVDDFCVRESIRWVVRDHRLERLGPHGADLTSTGVEVPEPLGAPRPFRGAVGVALGLLFFAAVGHGVLVVTGLDGWFPRRGVRVAVAFLTGTVLVGIWALAGFLAGLGVGLPFVAISGILALPGFLRRRGGRLHVDESDANYARDAARQGDRRAGLGIAVLLVLLIVKAAAEPMFGYDDRFQWAFKAKVMLHEPSPRGAGFIDPHTLHFHPRYPLLVPAMQAVLFRFAGGFDDQYVKVLFPLILAAGAVLFVSSLRNLGRETGAVVCALVWLLVPYHCGYGLPIDFGSAFTAYPDLILSVFALAALVLWLRSFQQRSAGLAALSAVFLLAVWLTKAEGRVHVTVLAILAAGSCLWSWRRAGHLRRAFPVFLLLGGAAALHESVFTARVPPGILPDNYAELITLHRALDHLHRIPQIAALLAADLFTSPRMGFVGLILIYAGVIARPRLGRIEVLLPLLYVAAMVVAFGVPFLVGPGDWRAQYDWAAGRLLSQLLPAAFWGVGALLLPVHDGRCAAPSRRTPSGQGS